LASPYQRALAIDDGCGEVTISLTYHAPSYTLARGDEVAQLSELRVEGQQISLQVDQTWVHARVLRVGELFHVFYGGTHYQLRWRDPLAHAGQQEAEAGRLTAPMPGKIVALLVDVGAVVERGAPLLIMEAMKMEHTIQAPSAGCVSELLYAVGDQVAEGAQLLILNTEVGA
jgi:3-methylcrotonyl-CoA carboxylase alpha subunit